MSTPSYRPATAKLKSIAEFPAQLLASYRLIAAQLPRSYRPSYRPATKQRPPPATAPNANP